jgi:type IV secretion system protein VirB10
MSQATQAPPPPQPGPAPAPVPDPQLMTGKPKRGVTKKVMFTVVGIAVIALLMLDDQQKKPIAAQQTVAGESKVDPKAIIDARKEEAGKVEPPKPVDVSVPGSTPDAIAKPVDNTAASKEAEERRRREEEVLGAAISANQGVSLLPADPAALTQRNIPVQGAQKPADKGDAIDAQIAALQAQLAKAGNPADDIAKANQQALDTARAIQASSQPPLAPTRTDINQRFLNEAASVSNQVVRVQAAESRYTIHQGTMIPAVSMNAINSMLPGMFRAQVTMDVYDTIGGRYLLIPKGSVLIGQYNSNVAYGQNRVLFAFTRLIRPDGSWLSLGSSGAADSEGASGIPGNSAESFLRTFGNALMVSAASVLFSKNDQTITINVGAGGTQTSGTILGQAVNAVVQQMIQRNQAVQNAVTQDKAYEFYVMAARDMIFQEPYRGNK